MNFFYAESNQSGRHHHDAPWKYDVFISHAGEDKTFAFRLRQAFEGVGLTAFVDQADLFAGADADVSILMALENTPVGLALLSAEYLCKKWPIHELEIIVRRSTLLPVLYKIDYETAKEALNRSPQAGGANPEAWTDFVHRVTRTTAEKNPSTGHDELPFVQLIVFSAVRICVQKASQIVDRAKPSTAFAVDFAYRVQGACQRINADFEELPGKHLKEAKAWCHRMKHLFDLI